MAFAVTLAARLLLFPLRVAFTRRQDSRHAADRSVAPSEEALDTGLRPRPFPVAAASLLPGVLALTGAGLPPAGERKLASGSPHAILTSSPRGVHPLDTQWIKQHLRIKHFYGTSANAVKTQLWIAITVYVLVAIVRKRLEIERELYTMLQILSLSLFEKVPLQQVLTASEYTSPNPFDPNQLLLFDL